MSLLKALLLGHGLATGAGTGSPQEFIEDFEKASWEEALSDWAITYAYAAKMVLSLDGAIKHGGSYSLKMRDASGVTDSQAFVTRTDFDIVSMNEYVITFWVYNDMNPAQTHNLEIFLAGADVRVRWLGEVNVDLYVEGNTEDAYGGMTDDAWYKFVCEVNISSSTVTVKIYNAAEVLQATLTSVAAISLADYYLGWAAYGGAAQIGQFYVDDWKIESTQPLYRTVATDKWSIERTPWPIVDIPSGQDWNSPATMVEKDGTWYLYTRTHGEASNVGDYIKVYTASDPKGPWTLQGNVIDRAGEGWDSVELCDAIIVDGVFWLYYDADKGAGGWQIYRCTSADGITFANHTLVIDEGGNEAKWEDVIEVSTNLYWMIYETPMGSGNYYAVTSVDGLNWANKTALSDANIIRPKMFKSGADIYCYNRRTGVDGKIYLSLATDFHTWVDQGEEIDYTAVAGHTKGISDYSAGLSDAYHVGDVRYILLTMIHDEDDQTDVGIDTTSWKGALLYYTP